MSDQKKIDLLKTLFGNKTFSYDIDQIRSKALLKEISSKIPTYEWKYKEQDVVLKLSGASHVIQSLAVSASKDQNFSEFAKQIAVSWENLARLMEGTSFEKAILYSAVAYEIAGYQANASCLVRNLKIDLSVDNKPNLQFFVKLFLERMFIMLIIECRKVIIEPSASLSNMQLVAAVSLAVAADGFSRAAQYFLSGEEEHFNNSLELFREAENIFVDAGQYEESNIMSAIASLLPIMKERSTWTVLRNYTEEDERWSRYLKLLSRGIGTNVLSKPSVSELWPSQLRAIEMGLLSSEESIVIRMPTSAGKTLVAELAMVNNLFKYKNSKCIYLAPYKSLVWEIEHNFADLFADLGFRVSSIIGSFETDGLENYVISDADVLVMTPEKFDLLQRLYPAVMNTIRLVIIDEGHIISDQKRGMKFELLITRTMIRIPNCRFLFLSAVLSDETLEDIAFWFNKDRAAITSDWRPSIQRFATFNWRGGNGYIQFYRSGEADGNKLLDGFVPNVVKQNEFHITDSKGRIKKRVFPDVLDKSQTAAELALKFAELGSVLIFCTQPSWAESVAKALYTRITYAKKSGIQLASRIQGGKRETSSAVAEEWLGGDHILSKILREGIGIHHGEIPESLKKTIEKDFRQKKLSIIAATNTLAQGVNLPIRTIIIHSCKRYNEETGQYERIPDRDYWNISGRAGRAGEETEGLVIHICKNIADVEDFRYFLDMRKNLSPLNGAMLTALKSMLNRQISENMLAVNLDADLLKLVVEGYSEENITDFMERSLVSIQARRHSIDTAQLRKAFIESVKLIKKNADESDWKVFSETGLSTVSCKDIKQFVIEHYQKIVSLMEANFSLDLMDLILDCISTLREMNSDRSYSGDIKELLRKWIDGLSVSDIISTLDLAETKPEELSKYIEEMFSLLLPWGVTAFIKIATNTLNIEPEKISIHVEYLPAMIKFGVPNPCASWAMTAGIPIRTLAMKMSANYIRYSREMSSRAFLEWLGKLDYVKLQSAYHLVSPMLEEVSSIISRISKNHYLKEIPDMGSLFTRVVGIPYEDRRAAAMEVKKDDVLILIRDYDNAYDHNAVKIFLRDREVGFVERQIAQLIAPYLDTGLQMDALVTKVVYSYTPRIIVKLRQK